MKLVIITLTVIIAYQSLLICIMVARVQKYKRKIRSNYRLCKSIKNVDTDLENMVNMAKE